MSLVSMYVTSLKDLGPLHDVPYLSTGVCAQQTSITSNADPRLLYCFFEAGAVTNPTVWHTGQHEQILAGCVQMCSKMLNTSCGFPHKDSVISYVALICHGDPADIPG